MKQSKKKLFGLAIIMVIGLMFVLSGSSALAADYPKKPIRLVYPFPAGSGGDIAARILADIASKELGVPIKVSNVTGGKGTIGGAQVAKAKKDGYELGALPIGPSVTQPIFSGKLPYGTEDLEPVCMYTTLPIVLVATSKAPFKTTKELIAYAKNNPGKVKFAHPGLGTVPYMMLQALESAAGLKMKGIPFKGLRPGLTAAVGGHVDIALSVAAPAMGFQKAGKLNILGVFSGERLELLPEIPTLDEDGVKDYPMVWSGVFAPKGLSPEILNKLDAAFDKTVNSDQFKKAMLKAKLPVLYMNAKDFEAKIKSDIEYFKAYKAKKSK